MGNGVDVLQRGERITAAHYAKVTRQATREFGGTLTGDLDQAGGQRPIIHNDRALIQVHNTEAVTIPQGSVFQLAYSGAVTLYGQVGVYDVHFVQRGASAPADRVGRPILCCNEFADIESDEIGYARIIGYNDPIPVLVDTSGPAPQIGDSCGPRADKTSHVKGVVYAKGEGLTCISAIDTTNFQYNAIFVVATRDQYYEGKLTSDLAAPSAITGTPTTCTAQSYVPDETSGTTPFQAVASGKIFTLVNRNPALTGTTNDYAIWANINGEFHVLQVVGSTIKLHQGVTTSSFAPGYGFHRWTNAATVTADEYTDDPTDSSTPRKFILSATGVTVAIRDNLSIPIGTYIEWAEKKLADGTIENELIYVQPSQRVIFHCGVTTATYTRSRVFNGQTNPGTMTVTEWSDDPTASNTPRDFTNAATGLSIVVRDKSIGRVTSGAYVEWVEFVLTDGSTELELTYVEPDKINLLHQGITTGSYSKAGGFNPWTAAGSVPVQEYIEDTTSLAVPVDFVIGATQSVIIRDPAISGIATGTYIQWVELVLADGTIERELTYVQPAVPAGVRQGITTAAYSRSGGFNRWTAPGTVQVTEYREDPATPTSPTTYISYATGLTMVIRSNIRAIPSGTYVQWQEIPTLAGGIERTLSGWGDC